MSLEMQQEDDKSRAVAAAATEKECTVAGEMVARFSDVSVTAPTDGESRPLTIEEVKVVETLLYFWSTCM